MGNESNSGGISFFGLLGIVFITLKLCGVIDWSWWWVTAPLWVGLAVLGATCVFAAVVSGLILAGAWVYTAVFKK